MGRMENLKVERVDAVGQPATKLEWVVVKSESPDSVTKTEDAARAVLEALAKERIALSDDAVAALKALAELLELDYEFKAAQTEPVEDDEPEAASEPTEKDGDEDNAEPTEKDGEDEDDEPAVADLIDPDAPLTVKDLGPAIKAALASLAKGEAKGDVEYSPEAGGTSRLTKSKQPTEDGTPVAKGKGRGLYTNVIFGG